MKLKDCDNGFLVFAANMLAQLKNFKPVKETRHSLATPHAFEHASRLSNENFCDFAKQEHTSWVVNEDGKDVAAEDIAKKFNTRVTCISNSGMFSENSEVMALKAISVKNNKMMEKFPGVVGTLQKENKALKADLKPMWQNKGKHTAAEERPDEMKTDTKPDDLKKTLSFHGKQWHWCEKCNKRMTHKAHTDDFVPDWKKKTSPSESQQQQEKQKTDDDKD